MGKEIELVLANRELAISQMKLVHRGGIAQLFELHIISSWLKKYVSVQRLIAILPRNRTAVLQKLKGKH